MFKSNFKALVITLLLFSFFCTVSYSQTKTVEIQINTQKGHAAEGVTVYLADGYACFNGVTDTRGAVQFQLAGSELLIMATDRSGKERYGIASYAPQYSATRYNFTIPEYPSSERIAGQQIDSFLNTIATFHDIHSLHSNWPQAAESFNSVLQGTLGIPGVFSVSPIPKPMEDGRLGLHISGILVEPIIRLSSIIPGSRYTYVTQI